MASPGANYLECQMALLNKPVLLIQGNKLSRKVVRDKLLLLSDILSVQLLNEFYQEIL